MVLSPLDLLAVSTTVPFAERLRQLAADKGVSVERAWARASSADSTGPSLSALRKVMAGQRSLKPELMEAMATALGVQPTEFVEYRLWLARRLFDPEEVEGGLEEAVANLSRLDAALQLAGEAELADAAELASRRNPPSEPGRGRAPGTGPSS